MRPFAVQFGNNIDRIIKFSLGSYMYVHVDIMLSASLFRHWFLFINSPLDILAVLRDICPFHRVPLTSPTSPILFNGFQKKMHLKIEAWVYVFKKQEPA